MTKSSHLIIVEWLPSGELDSALVLAIQEFSDCSLRGTDVIAPKLKQFVQPKWELSSHSIVNVLEKDKYEKLER